MIFKPQMFEGMFLIESKPFCDERGVFRRGFCQKEFLDARIQFNIRQTNISENFKKHTLRGFHFQMPPFGEDKIMTPLHGAIYNVTVDVRPDSATFLQWQCIELHAEERKSLLVPKGCANAFLTLADQTTVLYYMSEFYTPEYYYGFKYNDPLFQIDWPFTPNVISDKDDNFTNFDLEQYIAVYKQAVASL